VELALAFLTLAFLEVVLGIDNIIFISILTNKLPEEIRKRARTLGIALALIFRVLMLLSITWIMGFQEELFRIGEHPVSGRDLVLFAGGVFLLWKSTKEIYEITEAGGAHHGQNTNVAKSFAGIIHGIISESIKQGQFTKFKTTDGAMICINDKNVLCIEIFKEQ